MNERSSSPGKHEGVQEARQDKQQDDVAKRRPGQRDQQVDDAHTRKPPLKDGSQEPA